MKKILPLVFLFVFTNAYSQKVDAENPFFTVRGSVGIPRTTGSMMFRDCFSGVYEANLSADFKLTPHFFFGVGYQNNLFKIHKRFVFYRAGNGNLAYNTQIISHGGFLKLGYDKFISKTTYINYSLNSGLMFCQYTSVIPDTALVNRPYGNLKFSAPYVQPEASVNFIVGEEQLLSFSIMLSYTTLFSKYDPKAPRLNGFDDVYIKGNRYFMNWINIGLGFNVLIRGKKGAAVSAG